MKVNREIMKSIALINQIAITMMVPIIGCVFLGIFLDRWLHTSPLFIIIMVFLGMGAAFRNLYMMTRSFAKSDKKRP